MNWTTESPRAFLSSSPRCWTSLPRRDTTVDVASSLTCCTASEWSQLAKPSPPPPPAAETSSSWVVHVKYNSGCKKKRKTGLCLASTMCQTCLWFQPSCMGGRKISDTCWRHTTMLAHRRKASSWWSLDMQVHPSHTPTYIHTHTRSIYIYIYIIYAFSIAWPHSRGLNPH